MLDEIIFFPALVPFPLPPQYLILPPTSDLRITYSVIESCQVWKAFFKLIRKDLRRKICIDPLEKSRYSLESHGSATSPKCDACGRSTHRLKQWFGDSTSSVYQAIGKRICCWEKSQVGSRCLFMSSGWAYSTGLRISRRHHLDESSYMQGSICLLKVWRSMEENSGGVGHSCFLTANQLLHGRSEAHVTFLVATRIIPVSLFLPWSVAETSFWWGVYWFSWPSFLNKHDSLTSMFG